MYLSHKGTFVATATLFGLGLFVTMVITQNLGQSVTTGSQASHPAIPGSPPAPAHPGGTVPANTAVTPVPGAPGTSTTNPANTRSFTCAMCDVDGSGTVDAADITLLQQKLALTPGNPVIVSMITFCTPLSNPATPVTSCPAGPGTSGAPVPTGGNGSLTPGPTGIGGGRSGLGDCNSAQGPGQKDGITNLLDFELLRQELSAEVQTTHCDFDANGSVDIIDFTDYLRKGFNS